MIDVRDERHYNQFHIHDARLVPMEGLIDSAERWMQEPANTVFVVMSNDEARATDAWKLLVAEAVPNVYILEGGINNWIAQFADENALTIFALVDD